MMIKTFYPGDPMKEADLLRITEFLYEHLQEYRDERPAIRMALDYALTDKSKPGGFVLLAMEEEQICGAVIVNKTGMKDYIPENILVYIAVDKSFRGKGIGKSLMKTTIELAQGNIKLHVEQNNPARFLYEKFGFEAKYLEMRLSR